MDDNGEKHPYERLSALDPHIKTRMQYPGKMRGPKGGEEQRIAKRIAKRRAAKKAARKQKRK